MRLVPSNPRTAGVLLIAALLLATVPAARAQGLPGLGLGTAPADTTAAATGHGRLKHPSLLAFSAGARLLAPVHILKEETYDINDLTDFGSAVVGEVLFYPLDQLSIAVGGMRGGFDFTDSKPGEMARINASLEGSPLSPDSYLRLDGGYAMLTAYLGNSMTPHSRLNPYVRAGVLYIDWEMLDDGRDGRTLVWQDKVMSGTDWGVGGGLGTEYRLGRHISLDADLFWGYLLTGDEIKWEGFQDPDSGSFYWTNTHFLSFTLGLIWNL